MNETSENSTPALLQTGFRIFFLGASVYAVVAMLVWLWFYVAGGNIFVAMPLTVWHGHEMVYGYTMAVVAGFLLTAVMNWTGRPTLSGRPLLVLFSVWTAARVFAFMPRTFSLWPMMVCDTVFLVCLTAAVMRPIIAVKQWKQSAVFSKLILLLVSGMVFYGALLSGQLLTERQALRFSVYLIVSLILTIGRRVMPFFIERGVGYSVTLRNSRAVDFTSLALLLLFVILDIFFHVPRAVAVICGMLAVIHLIRLAGWYTPGIWKKPLLWILFAGYLFLIAGFILKLFFLLMNSPDDPALHAFTAGGIGIFTLGMMARVAWGHTGRDIARPPAVLPWIFGSIVIAAVVRTFFPMLDETRYILWIGLSQVFWVAAFGLFVVTYFYVLISPRPDGKWG